MKKKMASSLFVLLLFLSNFVGLVKPLIVESETNFDASQFVESVSLSNGDGPIGSNKISDSSSVNVTYNLTIGDGSIIDTTSPYTMPVPSELKYTTTMPIELFTATGQKLGEVTIINGVASIQFEEIVKTLKNVTLYFNFWSGFNKDILDYDDGNDLIFPTKNNPTNAVHVNFSKSSSGGGSGTSAISKNLTYGENNIVNWIVTINNGGYEVKNSQFVDTIENTQNYVPGSTTINYRNWDRTVLYTETTDLNFSDNGDGSKTSMLNFGYLTSAESKNSTAVTSIVIRYQTRLVYNADNNRYTNRAYSYDGSELIDDVVSTATYRGQGGGGSGDETLDISGEKQWDDYENKFETRPESITVELLQNDQVIDEQTIQADETGQWNYDFLDQLKYDETGIEYTYSVQEKEVPLGYTVKVDKNTIINTLVPSKKNTSNNLNKTPSIPKQGFLPKAGEKASVLFLIVGLCEVVLIFLLGYLLKNRHHLA